MEKPGGPMNFDVEWFFPAENELTVLWVNGPDRAQITAAADAIAIVLGQDPLSVGESRGGNLRILFMPPLAIYYQVDSTTQKVIVTSVWRYPE